MVRKLLAVAVGALWAALGAGLAAACGSDGGAAVVIESISPSSAALGTEITIHGSSFTPTDNDVGFSNPKIEFQGRNEAYLNQVVSPDGETLRFNLPDNAGILLGACAFSQLDPNEGCPGIGFQLPAGESQVFVANENGISNRIVILVSEPPTAQPLP